MTDYNDGEWHRWDGGECPVHPDSEVDVRFLEPDAGDYGGCRAKGWYWEECGRSSIIAFRVTKVYEEPKVPREFWLANGIAFNCKETAHRYSSRDITHVREVLPE